MNNDKQAIRDLTAEAFQFLQKGDHVKVIFGALKKLHITKQNPLYEDMVQEGMIAFVQAVDQGKEAETLMVFIYQGVYWKLINYLHKQLNVVDHAEPVSKDEDPLLELPDDRVTAITLETGIMSADFKKRLTPNELQYFTLAYELGFNMKEIAEYCHVSRQTVHNWRKGLIKKFQK